MSITIKKNLLYQYQSQYWLDSAQLNDSALTKI